MEGNLKILLFQHKKLLYFNLVHIYTGNKVK